MSTLAPEELKQAADVVKESSRFLTSVRAILGWYGYSRRGSWITGIVRGDLDALGLSTMPDFESAYIDAPLYLVPKSAPAPAPVAPPVTAPSEQDEEEQAEDVPVTPAHRISRLKAANTQIVSVNPQDPVPKAMTLMLAHGFSQLPVMPSERQVRGMVGWRSIGQMTALGRECDCVKDCMDPHHEVKSTASIFDVIQQVVRHDCVLVRDEQNRVSGIVTAADLAEQFQTITEPFLVLGDIETRLRRLIAAKFTVEQLRAAKDSQDSDRVVNSVADLTFGEYQRLLEKPEQWAVLALPLDRGVFIERLDQVRRIRNDVMHFDPDGIADEQLHQLRQFNRMLEHAQAAVEP